MSSQSVIFFYVLLLSQQVVQASGYSELLQELNSCRRAQPLGMISGSIHDRQITSSSMYPKEWDAFCDEKYARLYLQGGKSWCAKYQSASEWIQVDLGVPTKVVGIMTQGRCRGDEWVTSFSVSHSLYADDWNYVLDNDLNHRVFEGNTDSCGVKHSYIHTAIKARYIKVHVVTWNRHPSMRLELVGCQVFTDQLVFPPFSRLSASSAKRVRRATTCQPHHAYLLSNKAWCPRISNKRQWVEVDIGPPSTVVAVVTKGRGDSRKKNWVTKFGLSFSNSKTEWKGFIDRTGNSRNYIFKGNHDKTSQMVTYLSQPIKARYFRIHPIAWHGQIAMRVGLLGNLYQGDCTDGFMRISENAPCVENLAYNKSSWINNKSIQRKRHARHYWSKVLPLSPATSIKISSSNATSTSPGLSCVILDNFSVDRPIWLVDLHARPRVSGLVIKTPMIVASSDEERLRFRDYMHDLNKVVIYLDDHRPKDRVKRPEVVCGVLTISSGVLYKPRIHVPCRQPMRSRYVYIEAWGLEKRHGKLFSATLCDVEIYE